jgi:DNA-binding HxlR family transcriptional regulator
MKTMQELKMPSPIFIGRWRPKILFSLKERSHRHGGSAATSEASPSGCLPRTPRNLESPGLIATRVTRSRAVAVEYSLTKLGRVTNSTGLLQMNVMEYQLVYVGFEFKKATQSRRTVYEHCE